MMVHSAGYQGRAAEVQPLVSVLLPVYNVEPYLDEAIRSVQAQTLTELEIVVVDDGSTDGSLSLLQRVSAQDPRIRVLKMEKNGGIVAALNYGLASCRAPYIARMDGDDVALPERLEKQLQFLLANPEIALVGTAAKAIDQFGRPCGFVRVPTTAAGIAKSLRFAPACSHPTWLVRRQLYDQLRGYRDLPGTEDYDFQLRAVNSGFKLANLSEPLMNMRIRAGNTASIAGLKQRKSHNYAVRLYRERIKHGTDSYSPAAYEQAIRAGMVSTNLHRCAMLITQSAFSKPGKARRLCLCALAALVSPWQARYFIDRLLWRFCIHST